MKKSSYYLSIYIFLIPFISFADFSIKEILMLNGVYNPTGVAVEIPEGNHFFSQDDFTGCGFSIIDSEFRFKNKIVPVDISPINPFGYISFNSLAYDPLANTLWVSDLYSNYIREYTKVGDLVSTFSINRNIISLTYDSLDNTFWTLTDYSPHIFEYSKNGEALRTIYWDYITTDITPLSIVYDINRNLLWYGAKEYLIKITTDGNVLGMYNWDISQIKYFSGIGYHPINDQILVTEASDYYNYYTSRLWIYSTSGDLIGNHILNPYGNYAKGLHVSGNYIWVVAALDDGGFPHGIAKMDTTGKLLSFYSTHYWDGNINGIIELPSANSLWITQIPNIAFPTTNHKIQDPYYNFFRLSPSCEILNSYSYLPYDTYFQGITYDKLDGHLWIVDSKLDQVLEFTTSGTLVSSFPIGQTGCTDPCGITYIPDNDRLMVIDNATDSVYSFTKTGEYKGGCSIANITTEPEDISYEAPGIIWILEPQRAIRCRYEPPTAVSPAIWLMYK
ncbi:MAG: SdiA-regulated domain-containing protein [Candidatus Sumerlaeota bacterium]|nr:SdiA-regulated domain-containing protein [Candidatus Sumerlaeota bacterium]